MPGGVVELRVGCAADGGEPVVSGAGVAGAGVEGNVAGVTTAVRLTAGAVGCLAVVAVESVVVDGVRPVDGVPCVAVVLVGGTKTCVVVLVASEGLQDVETPGVEVAAATLEVTEAVGCDVAAVVPAG